MDQTVSLIQRTPKTKGDIDFIMFELKGKPTLDTLTAEYQALTGEPARLALANPACGLVVEGAACDVVRVSYVQPTLIYLTDAVDAKGWGKL